MESPAKPPVRIAGNFSSWHLPLLLVVALALRLAYLGWAQGNAFGGQIDGIEAYEVAVHFEAGEERALYLGQPNCNANSKLPGPLWTAFCVAGLKLAGSPEGVVLLIIIGNIVAIALTWWLTRDLFGVAAAGFAALFMAVSPQAVLLSSILWNPSLMPLFGVLILVTLLRCLRREKSRTIFFIPLLILTGSQLHMSPLSFILPLAAFGWLARLRPNWKFFCMGTLAGMLCYLPYVRGEMNHDWANTRGMLFGGYSGFFPGALHVFSSPFSFLVNFWNPSVTYAPGEYERLARQTFGGTPGLIAVNIVSAAFAACLFLALCKMVAGAMKGFRAAPREIYFRSPSLMFAVFILAAFLFFNLVSGKQFHSRYCLVVLPLIFALAGLAAVKCLEAAHWRKFFLPVMLVTVAANLWFMPRMSWFERDRIANSPVFVPGYAKLENLHARLKNYAPGPIAIRDSAYLDALASNDKLHRRTDLIGRYVNAREMELQGTGVAFTHTNFFELRAASLVHSNDPAVAFYGNGIALVAVP